MHNSVPVTWHPHSPGMQSVVDMSKDETLLAVDRERDRDADEVPETTAEVEVVVDKQGNEYSINWGCKDSIDELERAERRRALGFSPNRERRSPGSEEHFFQRVSPKDLTERTLSAEGINQVLMMEDAEDEDDAERPDLIDSDDDAPTVEVDNPVPDSDDEEEVPIRTSGTPTLWQSIDGSGRVRVQDRSLCPMDKAPTRAAQPRSPSMAVKKVGARRMRMRRGMTVDSGAADNVIPRRMIRGTKNKIRSSPGSRKGVFYVSASGGRIANEGECDFHFSSKDGEEESFVFQVAEVNKALCAVSYLVDKGYQVIFDQDVATGKDTSRISHKKTGKMIPLMRERNVWTIDAYIEEDDGAEAGSPFGRRG